MLTLSADGPAMADQTKTETFQDVVNVVSPDHYVLRSQTKGPDGKLYSGTIDGRVIRFPINPDGTLGASQTITSLQTAYGGPRMLTGIEFDPANPSAEPAIVLATGDWLAAIPELRPAVVAVSDYLRRELEAKVPEARGKTEVVDTGVAELGYLPSDQVGRADEAEQMAGR